MSQIFEMYIPITASVLSLLAAVAAAFIKSSFLGMQFGRCEFKLKTGKYQHSELEKISHIEASITNTLDNEATQEINF